MIWIIPIVILVVFEAIADILAKEWSLGQHSFSLALLALLAYMIGNSSWLIALKYGSGLARGAIIFSVASAILASAIGLIFYKEHLSHMQMAGVIVGILAIFLLVWE